MPVHTFSDMSATGTSAAAPAPFVELENVRFAYEGGIEALSGISFAMEPGERVAILGANGCGKSTLLKVLAARLPFSWNYFRHLQ